MLYQTKIYDIGTESSINIDVSKGFNQYLLIGSRTLSANYSITVSNAIERASFKLISNASFTTSTNDIVVAGQTLDGSFLENNFIIEGVYLGGSWNLTVTLDIDTIKNLDTSGGEFITAVNNTGNNVTLNVTSGTLEASIDSLNGSIIDNNSIPQSKLSFELPEVQVLKTPIVTGETTQNLITTEDGTLIDIISVYIISEDGSTVLEEGNSFSVKYGSVGEVSHLLAFIGTLENGEFHKIPETNHTDAKLSTANIVLDNSAANVQAGGAGTLSIIVTYNIINLADG